jgi:hypothetical protein
MFKLNSQKEYLMNTYTNAVHPEETADRTAHKNSSNTTAIMTIALALVTLAVIATYTANQAVVSANDPTVPYSNALELQYARPWLEAQNKPAVGYSNALELQYAQPWLEAQNKPVSAYSNALELQYAQPWLEAQNKPVSAYSNALEMQYAQPWLPETKLTISVTGSKTPLDCHSSLEMLYACQYGYGRP